MATTPTFGGTNGVPELDVGQAGSTRRSQGQVAYYPRVIQTPPDVAEVQHSFPQQNISFMDRLGWRGEIVQWTGRCHIKDATEYAALRSVLSLYRTGSTIDSSTGVHGAVNVTYLKPTILKDNYGKAMGAAVLMQGYQFEGMTDRLSAPVGYLYGVYLTIVFKILG